MKEQRSSWIRQIRTIRSIKRIVFLVILLVAIVTGVFLFINARNKKEAEVITKSTLEKMINVSELSTFEAVYNGITQIMNKKDDQKVDYYVYYEAKVKAGFNFEEVKIDLDSKEKKIVITLPEIKINDINVDIASLDYMFENKKADTQTVSQEAYKAAIEDVTKESEKETAIYDLAKQNAVNIVEALIRPFVQQIDSEYQIEIH